MNDQDRLPKSKSDLEAVAALRKAGPEAAIPLLPQLLPWLADINWPVAAPLAAFLVEVGEPLIPHLRSILSSDDDMWIYWILQDLVARLPTALQQQLEPELQALVRQGERAENDIIALSLLAGIPSPDTDRLRNQVQRRRQALLDMANELADIEHDLSTASEH